MAGWPPAGRRRMGVIRRSRSRGGAGPVPPVGEAPPTLRPGRPLRRSGPHPSRLCGGDAEKWKVGRARPPAATTVTAASTGLAVGHWDGLVCRGSDSPVVATPSFSPVSSRLSPLFCSAAAAAAPPAGASGGTPCITSVRWERIHGRGTWGNGWVGWGAEMQWSGGGGADKDDRRSTTRGDMRGGEDACAGGSALVDGVPPSNLSRRILQSSRCASISSSSPRASSIHIDPSRDCLHWCFETC